MSDHELRETAVKTMHAHDPTRKTRGGCAAAAAIASTAGQGRRDDDARTEKFGPIARRLLDDTDHLRAGNADETIGDILGSIGRRDHDPNERLIGIKANGARRFAANSNTVDDSITQQTDFTSERREKDRPKRGPGLPEGRSCQETTGAPRTFPADCDDCVE